MIEPHWASINLPEPQVTVSIKLNDATRTTTDLIRDSQVDLVHAEPGHEVLVVDGQLQAEALQELDGGPGSGFPV